MHEDRLKGVVERIQALVDDQAPPPLVHVGDDAFGAVERELNRLIAGHSARRQEELLFEVGPIVVFRWRNEAGWPVEYVSPSVVSLIGYPTEEFLSGARPYAGLIHEDDVARVGNEVQTHSASSASWFEHVPYRLIRSNGQVIWVADYTVIRRDPTGAITHYFGYIMDITERMKEQQSMLQKLATPVLQVWDGVLAMPVLGAVDHGRAAQMTEALLSEVSRSSAAVVILDLTGVESVDTSTLNHFISLVRAVGLLGCQCVISGIAPAMAQGIVGLDMDLSHLVTFGTLEGALAFALRTSAPRRADRAGNARRVGQRGPGSR